MAKQLGRLLGLTDVDSEKWKCKAGIHIMDGKFGIHLEQPVPQHLQTQHGFLDQADKMLSRISSEQKYQETQEPLELKETSQVADGNTDGTADVPLSITTPRPTRSLGKQCVYNMGYVDSDTDTIPISDHVKGQEKSLPQVTIKSEKSPNRDPDSHKQNRIKTDLDQYIEYQSTYASLSVISKENKDLTVLEEFSARKPVQMKWRLPGKAAEDFDGVIVCTDENKERLDRFANRAQKNILKNVVCGSEAPDELFEFEEGKKNQGAKRERVKTNKMKESIQQDKEISPKKKKKSKTIPEKPEKTNDEGKKKGTEKSKLETMKCASENIETPAQQTTNQKKTEERTAFEIGKSMLGLFEQFQDEPTSAPSTVVTSTIEIASTVTLSTAVDHGNKDTPLTETWSQCKAAINSMAAENVTITVPRSIVETLGMMCRPEFLDFMTQLHNHLQDQSCNHTCFHVMSQVKNYQTDGNLLSQLYSTDPADDESTSHVMFASPMVTELLPPPQMQKSVSQQYVSTTSPFPQRQQSVSHVVASVTPTSVAQSETTPLQINTSPEQQSVSHVVASVTPTSVAQSETTPLQIIISPEQQVRRSPRKKGGRKIQYDPSFYNKSSSEFFPLPKPQSPLHVGGDFNIEPVDNLVQFTAGLELSQVLLLPNKPQLSANRTVLRKAQTMAMEKTANGAYYLMYHLLPEIFTLDELANSRGTGLASNYKEQEKQALDTDKLNDLKVYVNAWCIKNIGKQFPDSTLNKAVTERIGYARKQLKKMGSP